jgi:aminoglycoside phosphotransferase (APT) family kinase protein
VRLAWADLPDHVRQAVEGWLGSPVLEAVSQPGGFSPGLAARLLTANGQRVFVKAVGPEPNRLAARFHRREAHIAAALPPEAPVPRLLWSWDEGPDGWVALAFEDVAGRQPTLPWRANELARVLVALNSLSAQLTPSPLSLAEAGSVGTGIVLATGWWQRLLDALPPDLDDWSARYVARLAEVEKGAPAASGGDTLLHLDLRADNLLLTPDRVMVVDWPHARLGAAWVDAIFLAPSVHMQGGPLPDEILEGYSGSASADPAAVTAVLASMAGYFTWAALQPPPPGLPTLRPFQAGQGAIARAWLARRLG